MNNRNTAFSAFLALLALPGAAENYFWSANLASGNWTDAASWRIGGDSEWDAEAASPPAAGTDTAVFRSGTHAVAAEPGSTVELGQVWIGERGRNADAPADVAFDAPGAVFDGRNGYLWINDRANFTLAGGWLRGGANEWGDLTAISRETAGTTEFAGAASVVTDWEILVNTAPDARLAFSGGVHATNILVNLTPYDDGRPGNSVTVSGPGTVVQGLSFAGRYYNMTNRISDGAVVNDLKFTTDANLVGWNPAEPVGETRFEISGATVGNLIGGPKGHSEPDLRFGPNASLVFDCGSRADNAWEYMTFNSSNGLVRVAGEGTVFTNFNFWVTSPDTRIEVADGAEVLTRKFILGQRTSGDAATISGLGTVWRVTPREAKVEGFFSVGEGGDGVASSNNWLIVENGARLVYSDELTQPGGQAINKTVGLLIGGGVGDFGNGVTVRSGAVVENAGATAIGGGFERVTGGCRNLLRVEGEGSVYRGGVGYADMWDSELLFGGTGSHSNALEVADGAVAEFTGAAWFGGFYDTDFGGSRITVDDASLSIGTKVDCGAASLDYGPHTLEVRGAGGVLRVGAVMQDNQCANTDWAWRTVFGIPADGRSTDAPMLEVTGAIWDESKDAVVKGNLAPVFDIDRNWAKSGRGNFVTLVAVTGGDQFATGEQRWWKYRDGLQAVADRADAAELAGCRLSVVVDREDPEIEWSTVQSVRLVLEAGAPPGTTLIVR